MFSFGIIAYELVTGKPPSEMPPMMMALKPLKRWYTPLSVSCPDLPAHIGGLIESCLDAVPGNRPTAAELVAVLRNGSEKKAEATAAAQRRRSPSLA